MTDQHLQVSEEQFVKLFNGLEHWRINKDLVRKIGLTSALFLTDLMSKWFYFKQKGFLDEEGYFYNTHGDIETDTSLSPYQQREALSLLEKEGIVSFKRKGMPAKNYYKIDLPSLSKLLDKKESQMSKNFTSRSQKISDQEVKNFDVTNNNNNKNKDKSLNQRFKDKTALKPVKADEKSSFDPKERDELRRRIKEKAAETNGRVAHGEVTEQASAVVASWKTACDGKLVQHEEHTKRYDAICRMIDLFIKGDFFVNNKEFSEYKGFKFKRKDFVLAFSRFGLSAFDPDYEPEAGSGYKSYLQKLPLNFFLYNPKGTDKKHKSLFIHFLNNEPKKLSERQTTVIQETPAIKKLMAGYKKLTKMNGDSFNNKQLKDFAFTEKRLKDYLKAHKQNIVEFNYWKDLYGCEDGESLLAVFLIDALQEYKGEVTLSTGWLCSDMTFNQRLPNFLKTRGLYKTLQFGDISS